MHLIAYAYNAEGYEVQGKSNEDNEDVAPGAFDYLVFFSGPCLHGTCMAGVFFYF